MLSLVTAVVLCVSALLALDTGAADAATGGVYGIVAPRDGWCANGRPDRISWWNNTIGTSGVDNTAKDDIFWMTMQLGASNEIHLQVYCGVTARGWYGFVKVYRTGQSVFFRYPSGATVK